MGRERGRERGTGLWKAFISYLLVQRGGGGGGEAGSLLPQQVFCCVCKKLGREERELEGRMESLGWGIGKEDYDSIGITYWRQEEGERGEEEDEEIFEEGKRVSDICLDVFLERFFRLFFFIMVYFILFY